MEMQRAAEYLCQLIAGIDPETGEVLPGDHLLRRADVREAAINARLFHMGAGGEALPPELAHQGLPWYPEEIAALQWMFRQGRTHEEMAAELKRSVGVIRNRLDMLGLADDAQD